MPTAKLPGTIHTRERAGRWVAEINFREEGELRRVSRSGETEAAAIRALRASLRRRAEESGHGVLSPSTRLSAAATVCFEQIGRQVALSTIEGYRQRFRTLVEPRLGSQTLGSLTVPVLERAFDKMEAEGMRPGSRQNARTVLGRIFDVAVRHGALPLNPVRNVSAIRMPRKKPPRALTAEEREKVLAAFDAVDERWPRRELGIMGRFMLSTGVRIGEMVAVTWEDLDLSVPELRITGNVVRVPGKGIARNPGKTHAAVRTVALPASLAARLRTLHDSRSSPPLPSDPVFQNRSGGFREPKQVSDWFREALHSAGMDFVTSHTFRKTCATILDDAGLSARQIADVLGHANPSMTLNVYLGRGQDTSQAAAALEKAMGDDR